MTQETKRRSHANQRVSAVTTPTNILHVHDSGKRGAPIRTHMRIWFCLLSSHPSPWPHWITGSCASGYVEFERVWCSVRFQSLATRMPFCSAYLRTVQDVSSVGRLESCATFLDDEKRASYLRPSRNHCGGLVKSHKCRCARRPHS